MPVGAAPVLLVAGLYVPGAVGVVRPCPALFVVPAIAQRVEQPFMAGGRDVQRSPGGQLDAGGQGVDVGSAVVLAVQHGAGGVLIGIQPCKRRGLPLLDDLFDLLRRRLVVGCPGDDAGRIAPLVGAGVGHLGHHVRVTAQYRHLGAFLASMVMAAQQVANGTACAALPMSQKLYVHGASVPSSSGSYRGSSASR
jgi:hypothetical protein